MTINTTHRDISWDIAKGVCILLMMMGHCSNLNQWFYSAIESFHMPFFFIAAGYFYKERLFGDVVKNSGKRLLMPLLIGTIVCATITLILCSPEGCLSWLKALSFPGGTRRNVLFCANWPCLGVFWFLAALFWCRIVYNELHKRIHNYLIWICLGISFFFAFASHRLTLPFGIGEGCCGLVFYAFGNLMKEREFLNKTLPIWCVLLFIAMWIVETHFVTFRMFQFRYDLCYPIAVFFACGISFMLLKVARMDVLRMGVIRRLGYFSIEVMGCHQVVRTLIDCLNIRQEYAAIFVNSILMLGSLMLSIMYVGLKKIIYAKTLNHSSSRL